MSEPAVIRPKVIIHIEFPNDSEINAAKYEITNASIPQLYLAAQQLIRVANRLQDMQEAQALANEAEIRRVAASLTSNGRST